MIGCLSTVSRYTLASHLGSARGTGGLASICRSPYLRPYLSNRCFASFSYKLLDNENLSKSVKHQTNISLNDIEIKIDSFTHKFNLTWLRDSCHCPKCTHQASRQRLITPRDFRKHMFDVKQVKLKTANQVDTSNCINPGKLSEHYLYIEWSGGHESVYSIEWLQELNNLYRSSIMFPQINVTSLTSYPSDDYYGQIPENQLAFKLWDVETLKKSLTPIEFNDILDNSNDKESEQPTHINANKISGMSQSRFNALCYLSDQLVSLGLAKIVNVHDKPLQVLKTAKSIAYVRPTGYGTVFDVTVEPNDEINLAYSSLEFDLHTDLPYRDESPGLQILHCIRASESGGLSYFSDSFKAAHILKEEYPLYFQVLLRYPVTFVVRDPYRDVKLRSHKHVASLSHDGTLKEMNYSPFMFPPLGHIDDLRLFYLAMDKLTMLLHSPENKFVTKMEPGDMFVFNNKRVLHGRSSYDAARSSRFLQGSYMDWDEIVCLREKLHQHKSLHRLNSSLVMDQP